MTKITMSSTCPRHDGEPKKLRSSLTPPQTKCYNKHLEVHGVHEVDVRDVVDLARKDSARPEPKKNDVRQIDLGVSTRAI